MQDVESPEPVQATLKFPISTIFPISFDTKFKKNNKTDIVGGINNMIPKILSRLTLRFFFCCHKFFYLYNYHKPWTIKRYEQRVKTTSETILIKTGFCPSGNILPLLQHLLFLLRFGINFIDYQILQLYGFKSLFILFK